MNFLKLKKSTFSSFKNISFILKSQKRYFNTSTSSSDYIVKIKYDELINNKSEKSQKQIFDAISSAYNKDSLGLMVIQNVPKILQMKKRLFDLNYELVNLPNESLKKLEKPEISYSLGWSYGKEKLGKLPDLLKASYYAKLDPLTTRKSNCENIWPQELPYMKEAFEDLGNSIREVGLIILKNIDKYIKENNPNYELNYCNIISDSCENTGRMLYYFPKNRINYAQENYNKENNTDFNFNTEDVNWCEWHNDHCSLTGLVSANYINEDGTEANNLNLTKTGLFVQNRKGEIVRITYGPDDLAFQLGESLQIHSGGLLHATPHAVKFMDDVKENIARNTFALFMEPNMDVKMNIPKGVNEESVYTPDIYKNIPKIQIRYNKDMNFGEFSQKTFDSYYKMNNK
jgi:isopenicillin N synthase-like dioxygenase